jgi:hypothetical protein
MRELYGCLRQRLRMLGVVAIIQLTQAISNTSIVMKDKVIKELVSEMNAQDFDKLIRMYADDEYGELVECAECPFDAITWDEFISQFADSIADGLRWPRK